MIQVTFERWKKIDEHPHVIFPQALCTSVAELLQLLGQSADAELLQFWRGAASTPRQIDAALVALLRATESAFVEFRRGWDNGTRRRQEAAQLELRAHYIDAFEALSRVGFIPAQAAETQAEQPMNQA